MPHCNLLRGITQPILRLFYLYVSFAGHAAHVCRGLLLAGGRHAVRHRHRGVHRQHGGRSHLVLVSQPKTNSCRYYRVTQQVSDLGWVDFTLDVPPVLPSCSAHSAYLSSALVDLGRRWNSPNQSHPNQGPRPAVSPCTNILLDLENGTVGEEHANISITI